MDEERLAAIRDWWETEHNNGDVMDLLGEVNRLRDALTVCANAVHLTEIPTYARRVLDGAPARYPRQLDAE